MPELKKRTYGENNYANEKGLKRKDSTCIKNEEREDQFDEQTDFKRKKMPQYKNEEKCQKKSEIGRNDVGGWDGKMSCRHK